MIDIIVYVNEISSLNFSNYDTWEDLRDEIINILGCTEEEVLKRAYDVHIVGFNSSLSYTQELDKLYEGYKDLLEFDEQDIILAYFELGQLDLSYGRDAMCDALDAYFGRYTSDWEAAYELLRDALGMTRTQALYVLDTLDCVDKIIEDSFNIYNGIYFLK